MKTFIFSGLRLFFTFSFLFLTPFINAEIPYHVEFCGGDEEVQGLLASVSRLVALEHSPPATEAALKKRMNDDIPNLLKALQSIGHYSGTINAAIDNSFSPPLIEVAVDPGPIYVFAGLEINETEECQSPFPYDVICWDSLGIKPGEIAFPTDILTAEDQLMEQLEKAGYPLAKMVHREVIADHQEETITVNFTVDSGPLAFFGETDVCGNRHTLPKFFCRKIAWSYGQQYDACLIRRTFNDLELSNLFSSINITHAESTDENGLLPMHISVKEAKPRTIAFGIGYATDLGPGLNFEWQHKNIRSLGERLSIELIAWQIRQTGLIKFIQPDFLSPKQDLIWTLESQHEEVKAFREISYSFSGVIERQINDKTRISYGASFTRLNNTKSNDNGNFNLLKTPCQIYWNGANSLLDPTHGATAHFKVIPALQTLTPTFAYTTQVLTLTGYRPFDPEDRFVLAGKATLGSIWGAQNHTIPPSERFYAGSDILLRGYHYWTVSPLDAEGDPIGGRSLMVYSLEMRMRVRDPFGVVIFYDVGNVYAASLPQFNHKQLQAAGVGVRYHTPVGPIRLDVAFPFTPRRHLDKGVEVYFSIGQTF